MSNFPMSESVEPRTMMMINAATVFPSQIVDRGIERVYLMAHVPNPAPTGTFFTTTQLIFDRDFNLDVFTRQGREGSARREDAYYVNIQGDVSYVRMYDPEVGVVSPSRPSVHVTQMTVLEEIPEIIPELLPRGSIAPAFVYQARARAHQEPQQQPQQQQQQQQQEQQEQEEERDWQSARGPIIQSVLRIF